MITQVEKKVKPQERPETERNRKLFEKFQTGSYNQAALGRIFKISRQQVFNIIKREKEKLNHE